MRFRHVVLIIVIIALIFLLLYSSKFKQKLQFKGGEADDIGKQLIGMLIGSLDNPTTTYDKASLSLIVKTSITPQKKFKVYYGSLNNLSDVVIKSSELIVNAEFNENYKFEHRIKNLFTSLMLVLTLIYNKYDDTTVDNSGVTKNITMTYYYSKIKLNVGNRNTFTLKGSHHPFKLRFVNINYDSTGDLIDFLNTTEKQPYVIIMNTVFKGLLDATATNNPFNQNSIGAVGLSSTFKDDYTHNKQQGFYGYITPKYARKTSATQSDLYKETSNKNYGFNYVDIDFGNTFNLDKDFDTIITKICEVNDVKKEFIKNIFEDLTGSKSVYAPIVGYSGTHSYKNYDYFIKLRNILHTLNPSNTATIKYAKTKLGITGTTTLDNIVGCTYAVNPDLLLFDE